MTSVQRFLGEEFEILDKEEAYLREILKQIRTFETELSAEEKEILLLEGIIKKLKSSLLEFQTKYFPTIAVFIAQFSVPDQSRDLGNRVYDPTLDECLLKYAEIEYYLALLNYIVYHIGQVFEHEKTTKMKSDKFYNIVNKEHNECKEIVERIRQLLFGSTTLYNAKSPFTDIRDRNKNKFIADTFDEFKTKFKEKYKLKG